MRQVRAELMLALARRSLWGALEGFDERLGKSGKENEVADDVILVLMVNGHRSCGAASHGFVQRGGWPARSPRGE